jgi:uncharacterized protein (TIGR02466 family)
MLPERSCQNRLFFTPIYEFKLDLPEKYLAELIQESYRLYTQNGTYKQYRHVRDAFQSQDLIDENSLFKDLSDAIINVFYESVCKDYQIPIENRHKLLAQKAWVNVNPAGGYNVVHNHPLAFYSGVYYLQAAENSGEIVFLNPVSEQGLTIPHHLINKGSIYTNDRYVYTPKQDLLLLFPAYLNHYVHPNHSTQERISIAINIGD